MSVRPEQPGDGAAVRLVHERAFGRPQEADLVDALRALDGFEPRLSLVADDGGRIVGHVLFTELAVGGATALVLAPLAVDPAHQGCGVGGKLVRDGLDVARHLGFQAVLVLGDTAYYRRFGFEPAALHGIRSPYDDAGDSFMVVGLGEAPAPSGWAAFPAPFLVL
jgi:putative acetyltransferase